MVKRRRHERCNLGQDIVCAESLGTSNSLRHVKHYSALLLQVHACVIQIPKTLEIYAIRKKVVGKCGGYAATTSPRLNISCKRYRNRPDISALLAWTKFVADIPLKLNYVSPLAKPVCDGGGTSK